MKIQNIIQSIQSTVVYKKELNGKVKSENPVPNDTVSISPKARDLHKVSQTSIQNPVSESQNVRQEKIELAKQRIEEGYYASPNVLSDIADKLLKYLNI